MLYDLDIARAIAASTGMDEDAAEIALAATVNAIRAAVLKAVEEKTANDGAVDLFGLGMFGSRAEIGIGEHPWFLPDDDFVEVAKRAHARSCPNHE